MKHLRLTVLLVVAEVGRIGIGICYDIRFQELAMIYAARGESLYYMLYPNGPFASSPFSGPFLAF